MSATVKRVRDGISTLWEALTPPSDAVVRYKRLRLLGRTDGPIPRRSFVLSAPSRGEQREFARSFGVFAWTFSGTVRLTTAGRDVEDIFDDIADETGPLVNKINSYREWGAGVRLVRAGPTTPQITDDGEIEVVISIYAECEETDGFIN